MSHRLSSLCADSLFALLLICATVLLEQGTALAAEGTRPLQLEVFINDQPTNLIGSFVELKDRRIAARRTELVELGLKVPEGDANALVALDDLVGVVYRYNEHRQTLRLSVMDGQRIAYSLDAQAHPDAPQLSRADYGGVLNYSLFAASTHSFAGEAFVFSGANATLDGRLFGPYGTFSQSAIVGSTVTRSLDALRLDTTWTYSDPGTLLIYRGGDAINGGLAWTRPIRFAGLQVQRNFALRPDLLTHPLPTVSGSALVPSTVDVYVDNVKTFTKDVPGGPFQISNVPILTSGGTARVVLRDSAGRETETNLPFFSSPKLLRPGLLDFSVEAGFPRYGYGLDASSYADTLVGSASLRGGIFDWLTLEGHFEAGADLVNGGVGAVSRLGRWGLLSMAGSASQYRGAHGFQGYVAYDAHVDKITLHMSSLRTLGSYNDLASMTAHYFFESPLFAKYSGVGSSASTSWNFLGPTGALDTVSLGFPLQLDDARLNMSYLHLDPDGGPASQIISATYSRPIFGRLASLFLTLYSDLNDRSRTGAFLNLSFPLGERASASTNVSHSRRDGTNFTAEAGKPLQPEPGSFGWRIVDREGSTSARYLAGSYRSSVAKFETTVYQDAEGARVTAQADGAIATLAGGIFLSNRIDDSFAVIDAGAANVRVLYENRPAGRTNDHGQLLIPSLRSYQSNKIAIDPRDLPVNAEAPLTQHVAAPVDRSGIVLDFGVKTNISAAIVILVDKAGRSLAVGSRGRLEGASEEFVVGYDGRAFIRGLGATNTVVVTMESGECKTSFPFTPAKDTQVVIGPAICQ
jgi:outer membrane usher protein